MARLSVDDRRRLLVEAAYRVAVRDGLNAVSTRAVTDEAGMPRGIFHYCFRSKDELLEQVFIRFAADARSPRRLPWIEGVSLATNMSAQADDALRSLDASADRFILYFELTTQLMRGGPGPARTIHVEDYTRGVADYFAWLARRAGIVWQIPIDGLVRMYNAMVFGVAVQWTVDRDVAAASRTMTTFIQSIVVLAEGRVVTPD